MVYKGKRIDRPGRFDARFGVGEHPNESRQSIASTEVNERQQFLAQSMQLEGLHREIITVLATVALKTNNDPLKSLLASQGINLASPRRRRAAQSSLSWKTNCQRLTSFKINRLRLSRPLKGASSSLPLLLTMVPPSHLVRVSNPTTDC